jgi:hypothetical protein
MSSSREEQNLEWWRALPPLPITMYEAVKLYEYSASNPTGVTIGKKWRRHNGSFDHDFVRAGGTPRWVICEYQKAPDEFMNFRNPDGEGYIQKKVQMCKTVSYRAVIRVKARCVCSCCGHKKDPKGCGQCEHRTPGIDPRTGHYSTAQMLWDEMNKGDASQPLFD